MNEREWVASQLIATGPTYERDTNGNRTGFPMPWHGEWLVVCIGQQGTRVQCETAVCKGDAIHQALSKWDTFNLGNLASVQAHPISSERP